MCRWIAYRGAPIYLEELLLKPRHSLIDQSLHAREIEWPTNGDGFGVGWYTEREVPGLFRDTRPIWNDLNLRSMAAQIRSGLFFAHVRKATAGGVHRANCHPFAHERWLFQHNGELTGFSRIRQKLYGDIAPELFESLRGSTDSECLFLLAMSNGAAEDPAAGLVAMINIVNARRREAGLDGPFRCTSALSDGERVWAVRYASDGDPRTLYFSTDREALCDFEGCDLLMPAGGVIVASEPLGKVGGSWTPVEASSIICVEGDRVTASRLDVE
ncbi:MAG: class II glutamine amidotransferase [Planctomycetota bacterium]